ncbi:MAG TPA: SDR family oxidoreductase, partial [Polyangiaceae bacterium]|nr:SDR family oxidoreductase [Polyangiaceae bacterium]
RVAVITGGSAGVGRALASAFARMGWHVAILARDLAALDATRREIEVVGGTALALPVDVADASAVFAAADHIVGNWNAIDVWINNAMATVFAPVVETTPEEFARVTAVTYLGYVHGTLAALKHMRKRNAGTIVQIGSALAYRAIPLQSAYCAAKFAIRGFTDSLRSELIHERSRIHLTMVQLPAVNTPQFDWARSRMPRRAQPVPPIHEPEAIAQAILEAAENPVRELWVGAPTVQAILGTMVLPGFLDGLMERRAWDGQMTEEPEGVRPDNLFDPVAGAHRTRGRFSDRARLRVRSFRPTRLRAGIGLGALVLVFALIVLI